MSGTDWDDAELVRKAAEAGPDGRAAERAFCERYSARVERYAQRQLRDPQAARDLTQTVLLEVIAAMRSGRIADPARLGGFVLATCRHLAWDENRGVARDKRLAQSLAGDEPSVPAPGVTEVDRMRLEDCVRRLPEREQKVVLLTYCEEAGSDIIAKLLATTAGNVRVLRHRALAHLAECVEGARA